VIKRYSLDQYDRPETELQKIKREDRVLSQINDSIGVAATDPIEKTTQPVKYTPCNKATHYTTFLNVSALLLMS
jgi:hypothetical protein